MIRIKWPIALATLFLILLGWYLVYTQQIVEALQADAETFAQIYNRVQTGLADTLRQEQQALFELQNILKESGVPLVLTSPGRGGEGGDSVTDAVNLPFEVELDSPEGQERALDYVRRLDARHPPVRDPGGQSLHYGATPEVRRLRWIRWLQVLGLLFTVAVGFTVIRYQHRMESERTWTAMARELAHQLGTPISSLQGWLEVLRLAPDERPGEVGEREIAGSIEEDLVRLERISHRFELIGQEPELDEVAVQDVVGELERYLRSRLPRLGTGVHLQLDVPEDLPPVKGNEVLLTWALENVVKNALDALAGRGGEIAVTASRGEPGWVDIRIHDTGPGVAPDVRESLFEPGVTTKSGGWGVGLALTRRIVEGVHGGRIELLDPPRGGATFQVRLPST